MQEKRIIRVQQLAREDEQYREMMAEHERLKDRMNQVLERMAAQDRSVVEDYLGAHRHDGNENAAARLRKNGGDRNSAWQR